MINSYCDLFWLFVNITQVLKWIWVTFMKSWWTQWRQCYLWLVFWAHMEKVQLAWIFELFNFDLCLCSYCYGYLLSPLAADLLLPAITVCKVIQQPVITLANPPTVEHLCSLQASEMLLGNINQIFVWCHILPHQFLSLDYPWVWEPWFISGLPAATPADFVALQKLLAELMAFGRKDHWTCQGNDIHMRNVAGEQLYILEAAALSVPERTVLGWDAYGHISSINYTPRFG